MNLHLLGQPKTFLAAVARAGAAVRRLLLEDHGPLLGQLEPLPRHRRLQPGAPRPPWLLVDRVVQTTRTLLFSYCPSRRTPRTALRRKMRRKRWNALPPGAHSYNLQLAIYSLQLATCNVANFRNNGLTNSSVNINNDNNTQLLCLSVNNLRRYRRKY